MTKKIKIHGGPGCGKTYTLTNFYQKYISQEYKPSEITVLTFRKNAAKDLIASTVLYAEVDEKELKRHVGTIHSICYRLIGYPELMQPEDYTDFVKRYNYGKYLKKDFRKQKTEDAEEFAYSGDLFDLYTWLRNTCTPFQKWKKYPGASKITLPSNRVPDFLENYTKYKEQVQKIDYSDMLQIIIDEQIPIDTPVLIVDEFQDFTAQVHEIFEMWVPFCDIVVIAGDPNQSIYGFWGGSPDYYNNWEAEEIVKHETFRLPEQIKSFSHKVLRFAGVIAPETKARETKHNTIHRAGYGSKLPTYDEEFHLIRCNYQALEIALSFAKEGKVFSGLYEWEDEEIDAANAIISIRSGRAITFEQTLAIINLFPLRTLGIKGSKGEYIKRLEESYTPQLQTGTGIFNAKILNILNSSDPTKGMLRGGKLFKAKINGVKKRKTLITSKEVASRKILTIHGAKGLEAEAVFLHTGITPRIAKLLLTPGKESQAEARVWYVGVTRAKKILYLITDAGHNYTLPGVISC